MKGTWDPGAWANKLRGLAGKYKYVLLVILAGVALLLLPTPGGKQPAEPDGARTTAADAGGYCVEDMERKLEEALSQVDGAGKVTVVLTVKSGPRQILAQDGKQSAQENSTSTVVVSKGSGAEDAVVLQELYPQYQGALVVCPGGGDPAVRLKLVDAVAALTGLGSDKISVCKSK